MLVHSSAITRKRWPTLLCASTLLAVMLSNRGLATCEDPTTHMWLSTSSAASFADVPIVNSNGPTTLYLWARLGPAESISDLSLHVVSTSAVEFTEAVLDNPDLTTNAGMSTRRYEYTPDAIIHSTLLELNAFTLLNQDTVGRGFGSTTRAADALYDLNQDAWRLGTITFTSDQYTELSLQIGVNGIQGIDSDGAASPDFGVIFGHSDDAALCSIDQRETSSLRADAIRTTGTFDVGETRSTSGSYTQSSDATLKLSVGENAALTPWQVRDEAQLAGHLEISSAGYIDPTDPGTVDRVSLIKAHSISGRFDTISLDGRPLFRAADPLPVTVFEGDSLFRTLAYSANEVTLTNYFALSGDFNGDLEVNFADFLILSRNFGESGGWQDGDATADGLITFSDFLILSQSFGNSVASASVQTVPEPSMQRLAICCLAVGIPWCRSRR